MVFKMNMHSINRREFGAAALALALPARSLRGATSLDETLKASLQKRGIPAAAAIVANADHITYSGAWG